MNYYGSYIKAFIAIMILFFLSLCSQIVIDNKDSSRTRRDIWGVIFQVGKIGNCAKIMMPLVMFFIRIQDPLIAKHVFKPFHRMSDGVRKLRAISKFKKEYYSNEWSTNGIGTSSDDSPKKRDSTLATGIALENEILIDDPED